MSDGPRGERSWPGPAGPGRVVVILVGAIAVLGILHWMREVLIPIAIAVLIWYPLDPLVSWLARRHVHRAIGSFLVVLLTIAPIAVGGYLISGQVAAVVDQMPAAARKLASEIERLSRLRPGPLGRVEETAAVLEKSAAKTAPMTPVEPGVTRVEVKPPSFRARDFLWSSSLGVVAMAGNAVMTLFLVYFLLASGDLYRRKLARLAGQAHGGMTGEILDDVHRRVGRFLVALVGANLVVVALTWVALWWLGVNQALLWSLLAGALNTIPYVGPVMVTGGLAVISAVQFGSLAKVVTVCGVALLITSVEGWWLTPVLMGKAAQMNAVAVFVSLLLWTWLWGMWGTLLAVPMMTALKAVADHIPELGWLGELLGE